MIIERGSYRDFKRVLFAFSMTPLQQDIYLQAAFQRQGVSGSMLGRCCIPEDHFHYVTVCQFSLPGWPDEDTVRRIMGRVAYDAYLWLDDISLPNSHTVEGWLFGTMRFRGMLNTANRQLITVQVKDPVIRYVRQVARRLAARAAKENEQTRQQLDGVCGAALAGPG